MEYRGDIRAGESESVQKGVQRLRIFHRVAKSGNNALVIRTE